MMEIGLAAVPNQALSVQLDDRFYEIEIKDAGGVMAATITRDGETVISGVRITAGSPLLPYPYQEAGNFALVTDDDALPYWDQFGITQFLVYVSDAEIADFRGA